MKFSYNWLQKYFEDELPTPEKLAEKVGLHSFELEGVENININGIKDTLIDWDVLPNRSSDCLCYIGMVEEISAVLKMPNKIFSIDDLSKVRFDSSLKTSDYLSFELKNQEKVPRATKRLAINVKVGKSPEWLKNALESIGQKSINNVVDITNYVMWVTGQPVHAFDYDKIFGEKDFKKVYIREAKKGEKVVDLHGNEYELDETILVTADEQKALDIGGLKGGAISGIDENTTRLMLAAVNFDFQYVRNASKKLKLRTDGSKLYENEVPLNKCLIAMNQMSYLLQEYAGATISDEIIDTKPNYKNERVIKCSMSKINSLLGLEITNEDYLDILKRLRLFNGDTIEDDEFLVNIPEDRLDLNIWQDIAEEIGRIYGYQNITENFPEEPFRVPKDNLIKKTINKISDVLIQEGFFEVYNRSIVKKGEVKLANSLNSQATALRTNLLDKLKERAEKNLIHDNEPKLFEIGKVFLGLETNDKDKIINEYFSFAGVIGKKKIKEKQKEELFYKTKGYLEIIFDILNIKNISWKDYDENADFVAIIEDLNGQKVGKVGVNFWEINLELLIKNIDNTVVYKKVSKYPKIDRDVAFWVDMDFKVQDAKNIIKNKLSKEAISLDLFDIYKDKEKNKKSFAFRIIFQSNDKTLSDEYVNSIMDEVYNELTKNGFEIR